MRRILTIAAVLASTGAVALSGLGAGDEQAYMVRAIFENAAFVIPGEDVKVAGVKVGRIDKVDVTDDYKAAVDLAITDPAYQDFRSDAECIVRPQSLIGEKFVECEPTQKRADGAAPAAELPLRDGVRLLPVTQTRRSVDLDLLNTVFRRPYAERFTIILNELGTGLAGRGRDLNEIIRRSAPALKEVDEVLRLLATQNRTLKRLAEDSDTVLAPLARERRHVSGFIENASEVAEATAERREALEAGIQKLPAFLRELRPTMTRLQGLSDEATPVLADLGDVAPEVNAFIKDLGPFSQASVPALEALGDAAEVGIPALEDALPITKDLRQTAKDLRPISAQLNAVLKSLKKNRGIERIMDYIFYQVAAINSFDSFGHYLKAALIVNTCVTYTIERIPGCSANFDESSATASAAAALKGMPRDKVLADMRRILAGESPEQVLGKERARRGRELIRRAQRGEVDPSLTKPAPGTPTTPQSVPQQQEPAGDSVDALLDYLFGGTE